MFEPLGDGSADKAFISKVGGASGAATAAGAGCWARRPRLPRRHRAALRLSNPLPIQGVGQGAAELAL